MNVSPVLLTDLYELTMAFGYWKLGIAERKAAFHHFYRTQPFGSGFAIAAGLGTLIDFLAAFRFSNSDLDYLHTLRNVAGGPLFEEAFLVYLRELTFSCDLDAVPEGTAVFPHEPLVRVCGPLVQAQLLESIILNLINYQTLVATKAARIRLVAGDDDLMEFGLRRAQGMDGGIAASRAAFIGGVDGVSNVEAGKRFGIPVRGTMAHSWVMTFENEHASFEAWAEVMPDQVTLLVDTYDTMNGVRHAVQIGLKLKSQGKQLLGIRLDSGDLLTLSRQTRSILDEAGLWQTRIIASNELDEHRIYALKQQGAPITSWGVGTRLVTGHDQPALGGVYKLGAIDDARGRWSYRMKYAGIIDKTSQPGVLQVYRLFNDKGLASGDVVFDEVLDENRGQQEIVDSQGKLLTCQGVCQENLLVPIFRSGQLVYEVPSMVHSRQRTLSQLQLLDPQVTALYNPTTYLVGMKRELYLRKQALMEAARARFSDR